jgi:hypothetical protein
MNEEIVIDTFKKLKMSPTDIKCLLHLYKKRKFKEFICKFEKLKKKNAEFFSALQTIPLAPIDNLLTSNKMLKRINKIFKRQMLKIADKIHLFFVQLSQDPIFISLDTEFINNPNQTNYNNLISYVKLKNDAFIESLNLSADLTVTLTMMSDDRIPMYNENGRNNTYEDMIKGDIVFDTRDEYIGGIKSTAIGQYEKYYPLQGILISYKVGQTLQQKLEISGFTLFGFSIVLIFVLIFWGPILLDIFGPAFIAFLIVLAIILLLVGLILLASSENN